MPRNVAMGHKLTFAQKALSGLASHADVAKARLSS
jgi:hypothetical protein